MKDHSQFNAVPEMARRVLGKFLSHERMHTIVMVAALIGVEETERRLRYAMEKQPDGGLLMWSWFVDLISEQIRVNNLHIGIESVAVRIASENAAIVSEEELAKLDEQLKSSALTSSDRAEIDHAQNEKLLDILERKRRGQGIVS